MKIKPFFIIKLIVVSLLFYWIFRQVPIEQISKNLTQIRYVPLVVALLLLFLNRFLMAFKWFVLLRGVDEKVNLLSLVSIIFTSNFIGFFIPSSLGVDMVRFAQLRASKVNSAMTATSIIADRVLGVGALLLWAILGVLFSWQLIEEKNILFQVLILCGVLSTSLILFVYPWSFKKINIFFRRLSVLIPIKKLQKFLELGSSKMGEAHESMHSSLKNKKLFLKLLGLNILFQFVRILQFHYIFLTFGLVIPFFSEVVFVPIIILITLMPISFNGLGVRETAFIYFFSGINIDPGLTVSASLMSHFLQIIVILPGGLLLLASKRSLGSKVAINNDKS